MNTSAIGFNQPVDLEVLPATIGGGGLCNTFESIALESARLVSQPLKLQRDFLVSTLKLKCDAPGLKPLLSNGSTLWPLRIGSCVNGTSAEAPVPFGEKGYFAIQSFCGEGGAR
jgi:hypothetical protein